MANLKKEEVSTLVIKPNPEITLGSSKYRIISEEDESKLESLISDMYKFIESNDGLNLVESEKDALYQEAQDKWHELSNYLNFNKFLFNLDKVQYDFLTNLLLSKFEYDVNSLFFALELVETLGTMKKDAKYKDCDYIGYGLTATDVTYLYHLLSQYKVSGLTTKAFAFANILRRIGEVSKTFEYYNNQVKELSNDITKWVSTMTNSESLPSESPKSKSKKEKI